MSIKWVKICQKNKIYYFYYKMCFVVVENRIGKHMSGSLVKVLFTILFLLLLYLEKDAA